MSDPASTTASLRGAVDLSALVTRAAQSAAAQARGQQPGASGGATAPAGVVSESGDAAFDDVIELSMTVPVIVEVYGAGIEPALAPAIRSYGGRLALVTVDGSRNPQIAQAFQVREVPTAVALIGGRPAPLFVGTPAGDELRQVLDQVLAVAAQNGVTGRLDVAEGEDAADEGEEPVEEPLPPLHQEAFDAISRGDYTAAQEAYRTAIAQNPRDEQAVAGLAQVSLLARIEGADAGAVRAAAAAAPGDADAQLAVADLDVAGGHLDDAFGRLLDVFPTLDPAAKNRVRERLLEYFEIAGPDDPRVIDARRRLTNLLF